MSNQSPEEKKRKDAARGITNVAVRGYKSLYDQCSIEIRPLTILAGANSSGKSSIMQPLLMLKQTLEATYDPGDLLLDGPNVRFTSADQLLSKLAGRPASDRFTTEIVADESLSLASVFRKQPKKGLELVEMKTEAERTVTTLRPGMTHDEIESVLPGEFKDFAKHLSANGEALEWEVIRRRCFLGLGIHPRGRTNGTSGFPLVLPAYFLEAHIRELIHVPGLRGNPERTYKTTAVGDEFPGTFENYVASVVAHWQATKDRRLRGLGRALETLALTWKVEAKQIDDTQVEIRVGRSSHSARGGAMDLVSIADVGFGVSQALPVVVALLVAHPGQLVYLEQPEIHLHPRAQVAMAQVLADTTSRGVRVVAETHSSLLILGVQTLVAEGKLPPDKVVLHWFTRRDDGSTEIATADLDEQGRFGDWPEDFGDVELKAESRFLDAGFHHQLSR